LLFAGICQLDFHGQAKRAKPGLITKTSIMLGVGEADDQVEKALVGWCMRPLLCAYAQISVPRTSMW
jgi:hypothetical protein